MTNHLIPVRASTLEKQALSTSIPVKLSDLDSIMFYHVSKIGWFLIEPSNLFLILATTGLLLLRFGFLRLGKAISIFSLASTFIIGFSPLSNWLILPLETRFPVPDLKGKKVDGVIVLGGAVQERQTVEHGPLSMNDAGERVVAMADLARRYPDARVIFTGGSGVYSSAPRPEAVIAKEHLAALGLAADRVLIETESMNTYENALLSKKLFTPKSGETWLLVTSAWHMPRSVGIFRQVGWDVVAYPVDFRTAGWRDSTRGFATVSDGFNRAEIATHEYVGLLVYWLTGKSNALFPAP
jgi:uncharacterized SAM-binding protein YcdF (DUF218 family)